MIKNFDEFLNEEVHNASPNILDVVKLDDEVKTEDGKIVTGLGKQFYSLNNGSISFDGKIFTINKKNVFDDEEKKIVLTKEEIIAIMKFSKSHNIE